MFNFDATPVVSSSINLIAISLHGIFDLIQAILSGDYSHGRIVYLSF